MSECGVMTSYAADLALLWVVIFTATLCGVYLAVWIGLRGDDDPEH